MRHINPRPPPETITLHPPPPATHPPTDRPPPTKSETHDAVAGARPRGPAVGRSVVSAAEPPPPPPALQPPGRVPASARRLATAYPSLRPSLRSVRCVRFASAAAIAVPFFRPKPRGGKPPPAPVGRASVALSRAAAGGAPACGPPGYGSESEKITDSKRLLRSRLARGWSADGGRP